MAEKFLASVTSQDMESDIKLKDSPTKRSISKSSVTDIGDSSIESPSKKIVLVDEDAESATSELKDPNSAGSVS